MRRVLFILSLFMLVCGCIEARTIIVEIGNIRDNHGNILVMAQSGKKIPSLFMAWRSLRKERLRSGWKTWIGKSLICPYSMTRTRIGKMDMLEGKGPAEGYVLKSCEVKDEEATFKLKLYYPVNQ